jgi:hypothetical protein
VKSEKEEGDTQGAKARVRRLTAGLLPKDLPAAAPAAAYAPMFMIMNAAAAQVIRATTPRSMTMLPAESFAFVFGPKPRRMEDGHGVLPRPEMTAPE